MFARRPASDENATANIISQKGTYGLHNPSKPSLSRPGGKLASSAAGPGQRTTLGDLTNKTCIQSAVTANPSKRSVLVKAAAPVTVDPIEKLAGKSFLVMQDELLHSEETQLQQRLERIAAAAQQWTTSHLVDQWVEEPSTGDDSESDVSGDERFPEVPIEVQLPSLVKKQPLGYVLELPSRDDTTALLPDIPEVSLDLSFCWSDEEDE